jgi:hypothetical protein
MSVSRSITVEFDCRRMSLPRACFSLRLKRRNGLLTASAIQPLPPTRSSPDSLWPEHPFGSGFAKLESFRANEAKSEMVIR